VSKTIKKLTLGVAGILALALGGATVVGAVVNRSTAARAAASADANRESTKQRTET
jgi:hypothetical protein